ncbi:hypothetical protein DRP53_01225 [candidate division WOR-3 bacterium]|uniref:DUF401 family protein n=1 Tax=candidate division WOR-3 bacterium TaxID=2052148 RepID=A0A660SL33_UNCW3|nr:MAG: hypothetical protein DRP53_01225 [candidate division WOR-3 bacterium]
MLIWLGFLISLFIILLISRWNLALAITTGAVALGLITMTLALVLHQIIAVLTDPSIVILSLAMGVIPIIGGVMKESGQIGNLINNLRIKRKYLLALSAAMMGLLPMPGGALLSAPILAEAGRGVADDLKAAINNWFRHLFILVYPLSPALIASVRICGLDVYTAIIYLLPGFLLALVLGNFFFLSQVKGRIEYKERFRLSGLLLPILIIITAPILDFTLKRTLLLGSSATLIGVLVALILALQLKRRAIELIRIIGEARPWNFTLILIGMFIYLFIFQRSPVRNLIGQLPLPPLLLAVVGGFLLGLLTGRVQLPASIIFPVYLATVEGIRPEIFAVIYIAIFFGYVTSPVHPCLVVSGEYFHVPIRRLLLKLAPPVLIVFASTLILSLTLYR